MKQTMPELTGAAASFPTAIQTHCVPEPAARNHPATHTNGVRIKPHLKKLGSLTLCAFAIFLVIKVTLESTALLNFLNTAINTPHYQNVMK